MQVSNKSELKTGLKERYMTMIALGGVIGAGLFVGSDVVVQQAGPAAVLSFLITGGLIVLVMRMLGEMACAMPAVGSFAGPCRCGLATSARPLPPSLQAEGQCACVSLSKRTRLTSRSHAPGASLA